MSRNSHRVRELGHGHFWRAIILATTQAQHEPGGT